MRYSFYFLLPLLFSCSYHTEQRQTHLINDSTIRQNLLIHINRFDTLTSKEGRFLIALAKDDSIMLKKELGKLVISPEQNKSLVSNQLRAYSREWSIKSIKDKNIEAYSLSISLSLSQRNVGVGIFNNRSTGETLLKYRHYHWCKNESGLYDVCQVYFEKERIISKEEWTKLEKLAAASYFWRIADGPDDTGTVDGSSWTLKGLRYTDNFDKRKYHRVNIENPDGSFRQLGDYLISLTGEDFSCYPIY